MNNNAYLQLVWKAAPVNLGMWCRHKYSTDIKQTIKEIEIKLVCDFVAKFLMVSTWYRGILRGMSMGFGASCVAPSIRAGEKCGRSVINQRLPYCSSSIPTYLTVNSWFIYWCIVFKFLTVSTAITMVHSTRVVKCIISIVRSADVAKIWVEVVHAPTKSNILQLNTLVNQQVHEILVNIFTILSLFILLCPATTRGPVTTVCHSYHVLNAAN